MKILLIRHGDPNYITDSLTRTGRIEAEILSNRIAPMEVAEYYVSPLGRARKTAEPTLKKAGRTAVECEWLREFSPMVMRPDTGGKRRCAWDWLPEDWLSDERFLSEEHWRENEHFTEAGVGEEYDRVTGEFDRLLAQHGYVRDGRLYRVERGNADTLAFFCHFGVSCVLMSHLMNISPMILWHGLVMAPSSVTTIYSEERRKGKAYFRAGAVGDISHLYEAGRGPSFSARFCEVFGDGDREN